MSQINVFDAEETEVSKSKRRQLGSRIAVLVAHLLKWKFQPKRRGHSWETTIRAQRTAIHDALQGTPSLKHMLDNNAWLTARWKDGVALARSQTKLQFHVDWIWPLSQVLDDDFWPD